MKKFLFAVSICGITHTVEPLPGSLPPESEVIRSSPSGATQLQYAGPTPLVFFRKGALAADASSAVRNAQLGLPTRSNETPTVKLVGGRQYRFSMGQLTEDGKIQGQNWEVEEEAGPYALVSEKTPDLPPEITSKLLRGDLDKREEVAQVPYYYGRELRKIDLKYTFKKIPGFDPKQGCPE